MSNPTQRSRQAIEALGEHTPQEAAAVYATLAVYEQLALLTAQLRGLNRSIDAGLTIFDTTTTELDSSDDNESASITAPTNRPASEASCDAALIGPDVDDIPCVLLADHTGLHQSESGNARWTD